MPQRKNAKKNLNDSYFLKQIIRTYLQEYLDQEMSHHLNALCNERTYLIDIFTFNQFSFR